MSEELRRGVTVVNRLGLHARAAAKLVRTAAGFEADISVRHAGRDADAKSIMGVMMLAAAVGAEIEIHATGADAAEAVDSLEKLIEDRFGEGE